MGEVFARLLEHFTARRAASLESEDSIEARLQTCEWTIAQILELLSNLPDAPDG